MSSRISSPIIRNRAAQLRKEQTSEEKKLWEYLRAHRLNNTHFRRQYAIGEFVVDFCAPRKKIIIELDGQPHIRSQEEDTERTIYLKSKGYQVLRFWDHEMDNNIVNVIRYIQQVLNEK